MSTLDGFIGELGAGPRPAGEDGDAVEVRFDGVPPVQVARSELQPQSDGSFLLAHRLDEISRPASKDERVLPVVREELRVGKREVETGRVRITRDVVQREEVVDVALRSQQVRIERVPIGRPVDSVPPVRHEGDTIIVPVVEEVLVVRKQLILKEEVRLTPEASERNEAVRATLRGEAVNVVRTNLVKEGGDGTDVVASP